MSTRSRIPSAIEPYLRLPPETSLILLTGTLACTTNWLTAHFVGSVLGQKPDTELSTSDDGGGRGVILVSWMRDAGFWPSQIRRNAGVDITKSAQPPRFLFLDQLNNQHRSNPNEPLLDLESEVGHAVKKLSENCQTLPLLVLDNPDLLLAMGAITAHQLNQSVLRLRGMAHSTIVTCSADLPLVSATMQFTASLPIENETAAFLVQQAHAATFVMSVRELTSGAAKDVSGVLRVTRGGDCLGLDGTQEGVQESEALYLVQRDGGVKVFGRGETVS